MPKSKPKPAATHWLKIVAPPEDLESEILDRIELHERTDLVLKLLELEVGDLARINTPECWCANPSAITKNVDRMCVHFSGFRCVLHNKDISIRRALDPLMKTKGKRAAMLLEHPLLQGIRDQLYKTYFVFEAGEGFIKRSIGPHQQTVLSEVGATRDRPLRGLVLQAINDDAAERAFDRGLEDAHWREHLEDLLNAAGELQVGWHGGLLTHEEQFRRSRDAITADHRRYIRELKLQEVARAHEEIAALDE